VTELARKRERNAAAQKRRRERARCHEVVFKVSINDHLVALLLSAAGFADYDLSDHTVCEAALAAWIERSAQAVIDDCQDSDIRAQLSDIKQELLKTSRLITAA
jgi:hypothetical protein